MLHLSHGRAFGVLRLEGGSPLYGQYDGGISSRDNLIKRDYSLHTNKLVLYVSV